MSEAITNRNNTKKRSTSFWRRQSRENAKCKKRTLKGVIKGMKYESMCSCIYYSFFKCTHEIQNILWDDSKDIWLSIERAYSQSTWERIFEQNPFEVYDGVESKFIEGIRFKAVSEKWDAIEKGWKDVLLFLSGSFNYPFGMRFCFKIIWKGEICISPTPLWASWHCGGMVNPLTILAPFSEKKGQRESRFRLCIPCLNLNRLISWSGLYFVFINFPGRVYFSKPCCQQSSSLAELIKLFHA